MLSIIDRYIAKSFLIFFLSGLLVFVTIFLAVDFMSSFVRFDVPATVLIRYYIFYTPAIIYQMIPVACLMATLFTLSNLNKSNELVALFSLGTSLARISVPILTLIALISVMTFWMSDLVLPSFARKKNYVYYVDIKKRPGLYSTVKTNKIWYRSENVLFNIQTLSAESSKAQGLTLYYFDSNWKLIQMIKAAEASIKGEIWELSNGTVTLFASESSFPLTAPFESKKITLSESASDIKASAGSSDVLSVNQLRQFIAKNKEAGLDTLRYEVDYYSKYSFAFAAFVMSLMGLPFSVSQRRSGGGMLSVGICVGLAFVYWILYSSFITLGRFEYLPPLLAAWGPNILLTGIFGFLLVRLKK